MKSVTHITAFWLADFIFGILPKNLTKIMTSESLPLRTLNEKSPFTSKISPKILHCAIR